MQLSEPAACLPLQIQTSVAVASVEIRATLSLPDLRGCRNKEIAGSLRSNMSKLTIALLLFLAVPMLLVESAHGHPVLHHGMEEITLFITFLAAIF